MHLWTRNYLRHVVLSMETDLVMCYYRIVIAAVLHSIVCLLPINTSEHKYKSQSCRNACYSRMFTHHYISCVLYWTEDKTYIGCRCSLHTQLLMRRGGGEGGGGGLMEQLQHGHQAQLYSYLSSNCFPLISLICHLKKKASRAATQTLLRSFFPGTRCSVYINHWSISQNANVYT